MTKTLGLLALISGFFAFSASGGEITLRQFSGNETVITMSEIPGGGQQGSLNVPADNWSRTVKGVKFVGGKEMQIAGRTAGELNYNPFQDPPTEGDPQGFTGASLGSWLSFFTPSYPQYTFSLDFIALPELPKRVGFLWRAEGTNRLGPESTFTATVQYADQSSASYSFPVQASRLFALESDLAIRSIGFNWSPSVQSDGPRVSIDDVRFEAVPEPATYLLGSAAIAAVMCCVRRCAAKYAVPQAA